MSLRIFSVLSGKKKKEKEKPRNESIWCEVEAVWERQERKEQNSEVDQMPNLY